MKKVFSLFLSVLMLCGVFCRYTNAAEFTDELDCRSAILIETSTMNVLYEKNADTSYPPASVTKIMTLLLVAEAIDSGKTSLNDTVTASDNASKMGGSQVYLKAGEQMSMSDMIKSVAVASANDCAVALAEHISGSEASFVVQMNERAKELGMKNTNFENVTGLDDTVKNHVTSARDIAIMSAELLKHKFIFDYTTIWMDTVRNGAFGLTNTNRLIRFYKGANGLKTGMTQKAGFCVSAAAKRGDMQLIAVIMGAPSRDIRNNAASRLLDFGFANYGLYSVNSDELSPIRLTGGVNKELKIRHGDFSALLPQTEIRSVTYETELSENVSAPVKKGDVIGKIEFFSNGKPIGQTDITADEDAPEIKFGDMFIKLLSKFLMIR
ncbi:MAG: D-alanyl-D-alanine carboxypeptidase [Clostridia bacterium]|nr:D-alanyl-D-alanine carboxypeptidase [Clostridia bacterium]